jgi:hypothetical protein
MIVVKAPGSMSHEYRDDLGRYIQRCLDLEHPIVLAEGMTCEVIEPYDDEPAPPPVVRVETKPDPVTFIFGACAGMVISSLLFHVIMLLGR